MLRYARLCGLAQGASTLRIRGASPLDHGLRAPGAAAQIHARVAGGAEEKSPKNMNRYRYVNVAPGIVQRRWLYTVTDWDDATSYVDENGDEVCLDDAREHIANDSEAATEADRRADMWETKQDALAARVTRHSRGIVRDSPA